jgi:valyl-tRNA synthetase
VISEEKIQMGQKLTTKLWNVARFSETFLVRFHLPQELPAFTPADRWILASHPGAGAPRDAGL